MVEDAEAGVPRTARSRRGITVFAVGFLIMASVIAGSLAMYLPTRTTQDHRTLWGAVDNPDRVDLNVWITKVDPASSTMMVTVDVTGPSGALADEEGLFRDDANMHTLTSLQNMTVPMNKGAFSPVVEQRFVLNGLVSDYPFDHYDAYLEYHVVGGPDGAELPVSLTLYSTDPFFAIDPSAAETQDDGVRVALKLRRSTPTLVYASFVMVLMLGLAVAAITAAYYTLKWRKGLLFPACGMMAAMLFALVPLRNAVPGSPPIGSVIDFASFFIAAITIAVSLIACVLIGYRVQVGKDQVDSEVQRVSNAAFARFLDSTGGDPVEDEVELTRQQ